MKGRDLLWGTGILEFGMQFIHKLNKLVGNTMGKDCEHTISAK